MKPKIFITFASCLLFSFSGFSQSITIEGWVTIDSTSMPAANNTVKFFFNDNIDSTLTDESGYYKWV